MKVVNLIAHGLRSITPKTWLKRMAELEHHVRPVRMQGNALHAAAVGFIVTTCGTTNFTPGRYGTLVADMISQTEMEALVSVLLVWAKGYKGSGTCDTELPYRPSVWR